MHQHTTGFRILIALIGWSALAAQAGTPLYPKGQKAWLEYSIVVEGDFKHRSGKRDEYYNWSTRRRLDVKMPMQAHEAQKVAHLFPKDAQTEAAMKGPDQTYRDMAKQMDSCPKNDTGCQMRLAMQMMNSDYMRQQTKASEALGKMPLRYQTWSAPADGKVEAKVAYMDHREQVYYTAGREYHDCRLSVQDPLAEDGRKYLERIARGFSIEVDAQTGQQLAGIPFTGGLPGQRLCMEGSNADQARKHQTRQDEFVNFFPKIDAGKTLKGKVPPGESAVISSGEQTFEAPVEHLEGFTPQRTVPVRVTVRWTLTRQ